MRASPSAVTRAVNPQLSLNSYYGDLGLDDGAPQNVFELDVKKLTPLNARNLEPGASAGAGQHLRLPDGKGSISFDGVKRYVGVDIHHDPGQLYALIFALLAVAGLVHLAVRGPPPRLGPHRNPRGRPRRGRSGSSPAAKTTAGRRSRSSPQAARGEWGLSSQ